MSEHVFKVSTTNTHISSMATLLVFRSVDDVLVQVKPSLHQTQVFNVMNLYFIHALLYNTRNK